MPPAQRKDDILQADLPSTLPLMALRSTIVYPLGTIAVQMGAPENLALLKANEQAGLIVGLVVASGDHDGVLDPERFVGRVGVAARVHERINLPGDTVQITLQGLRRLVVEGVVQTDPFPVVRNKPGKEVPRDPNEVDDLISRIVAGAETLAELIERIPDEVPAILKMNISDPGRFADRAATNLNFKVSDKDEILQRLNIGQRLKFLRGRVEREVGRARVAEDVKRQTEIKIEQHQREFYLRQQLRAIQSELGEGDPGEKEAIETLKKLEEANLPEKAAQEGKREIERMRNLSPASSEYQVIRTYLDWMLALPWNKKSAGDEIIELKKVEELLDSRHYGLKEAKERITEYLAVRKLRGGDPHGPILCFVGPPGTGKTSLGEAIASSISRAFYRISVGGVRDEAEIRGHRRTYVGAMPGLLIRAIREAGPMKPVVVLDEVDKIGSDYRGDPAAALLEVLDPAQNHTFRDHYLEVDLDLSDVVFLATANVLDGIPGPLLDRMELVQLDGYTEDEKVAIGRDHLLPRQLSKAGLTAGEVTIEDDALRLVAAEYTREAGVRSLERAIARVLRKVTAKEALEEGTLPVAVSAANLKDYLGRPRFTPETKLTSSDRRTALPGVATGLAVTGAGGDVLYIEASLADAETGANGVTLTGQLGDVMKESAQIALSYLRSHGAELERPVTGTKDR